MLIMTIAEVSNLKREEIIPIHFLFSKIMVFLEDDLVLIFEEYKSFSQLGDRDRFVRMFREASGDLHVPNVHEDFQRYSGRPLYPQIQNHHCLWRYEWLFWLQKYWLLPELLQYFSCIWFFCCQTNCTPIRFRFVKTIRYEKTF